MDQINVSQHEIIELMEINTTQFSWLNSAGSMITIFVAPFAGYLMDNYSTSVGIYLGVISVLASQMLASLAIDLKSYPLMVASKFMFGFGFEPLNVAKKIILAAWFLGAELSVAHNFTLAMSREITFVTSIVTPWITAVNGITYAFYFGTSVCLISAFAAVFVIRL